MFIPKSPDELTQHFSTLDDSEKSSSALKMCEFIIAQDLFGDSDDAWVVRQVLKYIPSEKHSAYTGFILANQSASDSIGATVQRWLGKPFDAEGAVILMESIYNEVGWKLILSSNSPFTIKQRVRILHKLQESNAEKLWSSVIFQSDDNQYNNKYNARNNPKHNEIVNDEHLQSAIKKWLKPFDWPGIQALDQTQKQSLWCAYAYLNVPEILMPLSKKFNWNYWANEQEIKPNDDHYHINYKKRLEYITRIVKNNKNLDNQVDIPLPELTISLF